MFMLRWSLQRRDGENNLIENYILIRRTHRKMPQWFDFCRLKRLKAKYELSMQAPLPVCKEASWEVVCTYMV